MDEPNEVQRAIERLVEAAVGKSGFVKLPIGEHNADAITVIEIEHAIVRRADLELIIASIESVREKIDAKRKDSKILKPSQLMPNLHPEQR